MYIEDELHVDSIVKYFDQRPILTDIYLSCRKGEILGILGRNGSGKSTIMKIIFGIVSAETKYVRYGDKILDRPSEIYRHIRYLPQERLLPGNIKINSAIKLCCGRDNADLLFESELIKPHLNKKPNQLSGGELRFVEIMLTVYSNADILMLDEPFNGLSHISIELVKDILRERSSECGIIITDHSYYNVLEVATRSVLITDCTVKDIKNEEDLRRFGYVY